jgi:hypothetical protein
MGHWSATHRKAAILGWFGFVFLAVFIDATIVRAMMVTSA